MWSVQTVVPGDDEPQILKESANLKAVISVWEHAQKSQNVITTLWDGDKLIMYRIPQRIATPELRQFFKEYENAT